MVMRRYGRIWHPRTLRSVVKGYYQIIPVPDPVI